MFRHYHSITKWRFSNGFNSLRAGKCVQTHLKQLMHAVQLQEKFQFPSSGKVCSDNCKGGDRNRSPVSFNSLRAGKCVQTLSPHWGKEVSRVSIPFERESVFRPPPLSITVALLTPRFNSLRAGKCVQTGFTCDPDGLIWSSFNSLRAGKCVQTYLLVVIGWNDSQCFNSLRAGKCVQTFGLRSSVWNGRVSIPFERESVFRPRFQPRRH